MSKISKAMLNAASGAGVNDEFTYYSFGDDSYDFVGMTVDRDTETVFFGLIVKVSYPYNLYYYTIGNDDEFNYVYEQSYGVNDYSAINDNPHQNWFTDHDTGYSYISDSQNQSVARVDMHNPSSGNKRYEWTYAYSSSQYASKPMSI